MVALGRPGPACRSAAPIAERPPADERDLDSRAALPAGDARGEARSALEPERGDVRVHFDASPWLMPVQLVVELAALSQAIESGWVGLQHHGVATDPHHVPPQASERLLVTERDVLGNGVCVLSQK